MNARQRVHGMIQTFKKSKKRNFTLLEVLIAFLLIITAAIPLLSPYPYMLKTEKAFIQQLEMDRLASLYYVDLLAKILKGEFNPSEHKEGEILTIEEREGETKKIPYKANYVFDEEKVTIQFVPLQGGETYEFKYVMPVGT